MWHQCVQRGCCAGLINLPLYSEPCLSAADSSSCIALAGAVWRYCSFGRDACVQLHADLEQCPQTHVGCPHRWPGNHVAGIEVCLPPLPRAPAFPPSRGGHVHSSCASSVYVRVHMLSHASTQVCAHVHVQQV